VIQTRDTVQRRSVNDREVQLFVGRVEVNEQVEYLIDNPVRTRARTVNFVDNNDWLQAMGKAFWSRSAFAASGHPLHQPPAARSQPWTYTLNFTTEVGVPWGINDVDTVVIPFDCGVFREDGNPTLFLQIVGVHHSFLSFGTRVERTGLL
jgi:hypothetical protein